VPKWWRDLLGWPGEPPEWMRRWSPRDRREAELSRLYHWLVTLIVIICASLVLYWDRLLFG
jgi:hypothetical protein